MSSNKCNCGQSLYACSDCGKIYCPRCDGRGNPSKCPDCGRVSGAPRSASDLDLGRRTKRFHD